MTLELLEMWRCEVCSQEVRRVTQKCGITYGAYDVLESKDILLKRGSSNTEHDEYRAQGHCGLRSMLIECQARRHIGSAISRKAYLHASSCTTVNPMPWTSWTAHSPGFGG